MKTCKKCGNEFVEEKGLINYCSLKCRNSKTWNDDDKLKKSISAKNSEKVKNANKNKSIFINYKKQSEKSKQTWNEKLLNTPFEELSFERLRKRVILEQKNKCKCCGIDKWNNEPITLELEHIDGNHHNNERNNLKAICPNCHSQTLTWRGRNKQNNRKKISNDDIVKSYLKSKNIRQTLIDVGLSAKGGNYKRLHQIIKNFEL